MALVGWWESQGVLQDVLDFFFNIEKQYYYSSSFTHVICSTQYIHLKIYTCEFHFMLYNLIQKESSIINRTIRWLDKKFGNLGCLILWFCLLNFFFNHLNDDFSWCCVLCFLTNLLRNPINSQIHSPKIWFQDQTTQKHVEIDQNIINQLSLDEFKFFLIIEIFEILLKKIIIIKWCWSWFRLSAYYVCPSNVDILN